MKRTMTIAICAVALALIPLSSVWAVWEGNAGIAAAGEFAGSGLFARSDMFPKNTVVEIRNLENEKTVKAVITGSSGVPGLVAMLSPETAAALSIRSGSVARVRISIPAVVERPAPGTYNESTDIVTADPDANPAIAATAAIAADPALEPVAVAEETPSAAEEPAVAETATPVTDAPVVAEAVAPVDDTAAAESSEDVASGDNVAPSEEVPATDETGVINEPEVVLADEAAPEAETEIVSAMDAAAVVAEAAPAAPAPEEAAPEEAVPAETVVTLVPADALPPEAPAVEPSSIPLVDAIAQSTEPVKGIEPTVAVIETPTAVPVTAEPAAITAEPVDPAPPAVVAPPAAPIATGDIPLITSLSKGAYYIQIGTYADVKNVRLILTAYGKKYPVAVEKTMTKNGECLKVYIGPVMKDEYGAVLEKFKSSGFKDAFVRKGQ